MAATFRYQMDTYLIEPLARRFGDRLVAAACFGSAVPHVDSPTPPMLADVNLALVFDRLDLAVYEALRPLVKDRELETLELILFGVDELPALARAFPLEARALRRERVVLYGRDVFAAWPSDERFLGHQALYEALSQRQALRHVLAQRAPTEADVGARILSMQRTFRGIARGLAEARGARVGPSQEDLFAWLAGAAGLGPAAAEALRDLRGTREERRRPSGSSGDKLAIFLHFLEAWDCLVRLAMAGPGRRRPAAPRPTRRRRRGRPGRRGRRR